MLRAIAVTRASDAAAEELAPISGRAVLQHDERHLRRRLIELVDGRKVMVDLPETVVLDAGDTLVLADGGRVEIAAAYEPLYEIFGEDPVHLSHLAWHIGNRHLAAAIEPTRILILRDHVIKAMLEGLGATVADVSEPFKPVRGAYSGHGGQSHDHGHAHAHSHAEAHGHSHGEAHSHSHAGHHHDHD